MQAREVLLAGVVGLTLAAPASAAQRGPDAHMIRQIRGDVLVIRESPEIDRYAAPHKGWSYKPVRAGQRLQRAFYGPRYVVAAPRGTPPARGTRRWIRYGDDLLLVNVRGGRIDRVLPGGYRLAYPRQDVVTNPSGQTVKTR